MVYAKISFHERNPLEAIFWKGKNVCVSTFKKPTQTCFIWTWRTFYINQKLVEWLLNIDDYWENHITWHWLRPLIIGIAAACRSQKMWFTESSRLSLKVRRACSGSSMSSFKIWSHLLTRLCNTLKSAIIYTLSINFRFKYLINTSQETYYLFYSLKEKWILKIQKQLQIWNVCVHYILTKYLPGI